MHFASHHVKRILHYFREKASEPRITYAICAIAVCVGKRKRARVTGAYQPWCTACFEGSRHHRMQRPTPSRTHPHWSCLGARCCWRPRRYARLARQSSPPGWRLMRSAAPRRPIAALDQQSPSPASAGLARSGITARMRFPESRPPSGPSGCRRSPPARIAQPL